MPKIGARIKEKREQMGLTQEDLAQKLGYKNKSTIAKIENGTNDIVQSKVVDFAKALDTTIAYLMDWDEEYGFRNTPGKSVIDFESSKKLYDKSNFRKNRLETQIIENIEKLNNNGKKSLLDYSNVLLGNPDFANEDDETSDE